MNIVVAAAFVWVVLYSNLEWFAALLLQVAGMSRGSRLGEAFSFFIYEVPKVLLLLTGVVFVMGVVHTFVSPERTRAMLSGRRTGVGNVMAACLGIVTPFCSCSAVPLFIGFLQAGVPLGVTFSFLIAAPMINEVALALLFGMFGWRVALLYMGMGLLIAIFAGLVIGKLRMERYLEDWVQKLQEHTVAAEADGEVMSWALRLSEGGRHVREIVGKVWLYIVLGVGLGAGIHGYVPENFMASLMGNSYLEKDKLWLLLGCAGPLEEEASDELLAKAIKLTLDSSAIFSIHSITDWLGLAGILKGYPYCYRINVPGTVSPQNWSLRLPITLEALLSHPVNEKILAMNQAAGRIA